MTYFKDKGGDLVDLGYLIVPIKPGQKRPMGTEWQKQHINRQQWAQMVANGSADAGVGILCGQGGVPITLLDIDCLDAEVSEAMTEWVIARWGYTVERVGRAPKMGLVYQAEMAGWAKQRTAWADSDGTVHALEWLGSGQQFVAYGIHPDTQREYSQDGMAGTLLDWQAADLPVVTADDIADAMAEFDRLAEDAGWTRVSGGRDRARVTVQGAADWEDEDGPVAAFEPPLKVDQTTLADVKSALAHATKEAATDRETWVAVAQELKSLEKYPAASDAPLFEWFDKFSQKAEDEYDAPATAKLWSNAAGDRTSHLALFKRASEKWGWINPMRARQREENRRIGEGNEHSGLPEIMTVEDMRENCVHLADGNRVIDLRNPAHNLTFPDFRAATAASFTVSGERRKRTLHADIWQGDTSRQSAISTTFRAGHGPFIKDPEGRDCVNLWNGYRHLPAEGTGDAALFVEHVRLLFGDRADDFLNWLAHIWQSPGVLPHTAWVHIASHTGTGRNALASILARVFAGYVAASFNLADTLKNGFNGRMSRKVLLIVDEIREGGPGQYNAAEKLKSLVTEEIRTINPKSKGQSVEFNAARFLVFSNHRQAIPLADNDRRFEVVIYDDPPQSEDYYARLYAAINDLEFIAAVVVFLQNRDLSEFNPGRHAKLTTDKAQVVEASRSDELRALLEFNESYPFELATTARLCEVINLPANSAAAARILEDAGWGKLKTRKTIAPGKKLKLCARQEHYGKWSTAITGFRSQIPIVDGGDAEWSAPGFDDQWSAT